MADKDLHISGATIRESGTEETHVASSVGVLRFATFTEDNQAGQFPAVLYQSASQGGADV
mgnify:FL=1